MLHFVTRAGRNSYLARRGIHAVSLDSVTDERGRRMIENLEITAWAGVEAAFRQLALTWGWFAVPGREPVHVTVLGSGALGSHAVRAATRYGDHEVRDALHQAGVPGVEVSVLDHDLTWHEAYMLQVLRRTDILVDATLRPDPSVPVVANPWLEVMPPHAVLLDLAADPYDLTLDPPLIKGIEGVPAGTIERHVFAADDPAWDELGENVGTSFRRTALSCNAWPGLRARESMELYGEQLERVMEVVLEVPIQEWDKRTGYQRERAVARAELARWLEGHRW
jgi:alanine dehydrogenase